MDTYQIKDCCEEALDISGSHGVYAGLSFLIGEKFCSEYHKLRLLSQKLKYLYPADIKDIAANSSNVRPFEISYSITLQENYSGVFDRVQILETTLKHFVEEIKNSFRIGDICEYLKTYPRLEFKNYLDDSIFDLPTAEMTGQEILSEAEDILIIEDLKKMFFEKA